MWSYTDLVYACMDVCMYGCMHVWMYACMDVCMYVCVCRRDEEIGRGCSRTVELISVMELGGSKGWMLGLRQLLSLRFSDHLIFANIC
jgi:hypothetical protein